MTDRPKKFFIHDLREIPASAYRMRSDGRQWHHAAVQRQRLAMFLATYPDADGSRCRPSRETMAAHLSCSVRSVQRILNDLDTIGFQRKVGLHGESGTAVRQLNIDALRGGVPSSTKEECHLREQECQLDGAGVPSSIGGVPSTIGTQPPALDLQPKPPTTTVGGGKSLQEKYLATIGTIDQLPRMEAEEGRDVLDEALASIVKEGFDGAKSKVGVTLYRLPEHIARAKQRRADTLLKQRDAAVQEASIARQTEEIVKRRDEACEARAKSEISVEDFLADPETAP